MGLLVGVPPVNKTGVFLGHTQAPSGRTRGPAFYGPGALPPVNLAGAACHQEDLICLHGPGILSRSPLPGFESLPCQDEPYGLPSVPKPHLESGGDNGPSFLGLLWEIQ